MAKGHQERWPLWSAQQAAQADRLTIHEMGMTSAVLIERAALAVARAVQEVVATGPQQVAVMCGKGNNGADGLALARILAGRDVAVRVFLPLGTNFPALADQVALATKHGLACELGLPDEMWLADPNVVWVDALLGTGAHGRPTGEIAAAIVALGRRKGPLVAIDLPSGVDASTGEVAGDVVTADVTVTFQQAKVGLLITPGAHFCGRIVVAEIGLTEPPSPARHEMLHPSLWTGVCAGLQRAAHKGQRGHVGIIGGDLGMQGAPWLSARAALRASAGLVSVSHWPGQVALPEALPEALTVELDPSHMRPLARADVLVVGPGLHAANERAAWLHELAVHDSRPAVWDASALPFFSHAAADAGPRVLTPHPGEAALLLNAWRPGETWTNAKVQASRHRAVQVLAQASASVVVLKGEHTLIANGEQVAVCSAGSSALAIGGSGDVLAGVIAALMARGLSAWDAARLGVHAHACAGEDDRGALSGMLATDIADRVPQVLMRWAAGDAPSAFERWYY